MSHLRSIFLFTCITLAAAWAPLAHADTAAAPLRGLGGQVAEVSHRVDIELSGLVARGSTTQTVVATGDTAEAIYTFALPSTAAVTGLSVTLPGGRTTRAELIDATVAFEPAPHPRGAQADTALLRLVEVDGERSTYELRVFPVPVARTTTWTITWLAPVDLHDGRMLLRLPARGAHDNLVAEQVRISGSPPPGYDGIESIIGSGTRLPGRLPAQFTGGLLQGIVVELVPRAKDGKPQLEHASVALPGGRSALAYWLWTPKSSSKSADTPKRILLVVDVSRSMGESGRRAAEEIAGSILDHAPVSTGIDAILFDRDARFVLGEFAPNQADAQTAIRRAIIGAPLANGSDLGAALELVNRRLRGKAGDAMVIFVSDAMTPAELAPADAAAMLHSDVLADARFAHIAMVPEGAPVPERAAIAVSGLTHENRGRLLSIRPSEVGRLAPTLWKELLSPPPLQSIEVEGGDDIVAEHPDKLAPEADAFAVGFARRPSSRKLGLRALFGDRAVELRSRYRADLERVVLPLLLSSMQALPGDFDDLGLGELAKRAGVVTWKTALWAPAPGDAFAKARLEMARKWGIEQFRRLPPAVEREEELRRYEFLAPPPLDEPPPSRTLGRATGTLDRSIVERLMRTHVVPKVHGCYRQALVPAKDLRGTFTIVVEMARGEVSSARIEGSLKGNATWAAKIEACALDAAYSIRVPTVQQGDSLETISVARYPLTFKIVDAQGRVVEGVPTEIDTSDPLEGL